MHYVSVAPLAVSRRDTYTYRSATALPAGTVVSIPYAGRRGSGVVTGPADADERAKVAEPTGERLPDWQMRFGRGLAEACLSPLGQTLGLFLPKWREGAASEVPPRTDAGNANPRLETGLDLADFSEPRSREHQTLVLVPERAMLRHTPDAGLRFAATLPTTERREVWERVRAGAAKPVFGTRSALFLPWKRLGEVVVLHEDELGYQNDRTPRYHAREAARLLANAHGAHLTLASPAPSLRAWQLAGRPEVTLPDIPAPVLAAPRYERFDDPLPYGFAEKLADLDGPLLVHSVQSKVKAVRDAVRDAGLKDVVVEGQAAALAGKRYASVVDLGVDAILARPGFAVTERAVALLRKLGGLVRPDGTFLVYSERSDHPAFDALTGPYDRFLRSESADRQVLALPPTKPLVRIAAPVAERPKIERTLAALALDKKDVRFTTDADTVTILIKGDPRRLRGLMTPERRISVDY